MIQIDQKDLKLICEVEREISYEFSSKLIIMEALTHPSYKDIRKKSTNYERLEFLGDSVLNLVISELLFRKYEQKFEGDLSKLRSKLVSSSAISSIAQKINLGDKIFMSKGEESNGGRYNKRNLENVLEAIIGAVYLDSGLNNVRIIIENLWTELLRHNDNLEQDSKTFLQEWAHKNGYGAPEYTSISIKGPSHAPDFEIKVSIDSKRSAVANGKNKKEAEQAAASKFIKQFIIENRPLQKPAPGKQVPEAQGTEEDRSVHKVHEGPATCASRQLKLGIEFPEGSNDSK
ncbi:MAG: ribonuclease III [Rickettsiaceae bacterium]|nr:ribonuclease III [Rickettsiaceae bacterium]